MTVRLDRRRRSEEEGYRSEEEEKKKKERKKEATHYNLTLVSLLSWVSKIEFKTGNW